MNSVIYYIFLSILTTRIRFLLFFFFNDTATTEIYTLSLHDALPISSLPREGLPCATTRLEVAGTAIAPAANPEIDDVDRSEEHTSELQSRLHLVCRLLLEKKKKKNIVRKKNVQ